MSLYILIHKPTIEECKDVSEYLYETLNKLYPDKVHSYYDGTCMDIWGRRIHIETRHGEAGRLAGVWPNYYYTEDNECVADLLEQGACKVNGRRLNFVSDVLSVVSGFMAMFSQIDTWLDEED